MPIPHGEDSSSNGNLDTKVEILFSQIDHLRELVFQRLDSEKEEREHQAQEYERRLGELNHAHQEAKEKEGDFVDKRMAAVQQEELLKKIELNNTQLIMMNTIPADLRALFTWKEEVVKAMGKIEGMGLELNDHESNLKAFDIFKQDMNNWRSRVIGMAIGAGTICGAIGGFVSHWVLK